MRGRRGRGGPRRGGGRGGPRERRERPPVDVVRPFAELEATLARIDGRSYPAYRDLEGGWEDDDYTLWVDHVQGDPFADPSRLRVIVPADVARLPGWALETPARRVSAADFLQRAFARHLDRAGERRGSGKSGLFRAVRPGQCVLPRSGLVVRAGGEVEARFQLGLPAAGRRVLGRQAAACLGEDLPDAVAATLLVEALDEDALRAHLEAVDDAQALRAQLDERGLVAFVANGALLPRRAGDDDRPLPAEQAVTFAAPDSLTVTLETPHSGELQGLGIPRGVTLITGGGFHGKSTLLRALERGVYDHLPGDGRERVVADPALVKVRAEDGRPVAGVDISPLIGELPGGQDTRAFSTQNASGSTSQAAAIAEALEAGATGLLLDEDTSATNLLIRDARMQALVPQEREPITPLIDRVRTLVEERRVSAILVVGGSGDYLDVADVVIALDHYRPQDVTRRAWEVAQALPTRRHTGARAPWPPAAPRRLAPGCLQPGKGRKERALKVMAPDRLLFGEEEVRLTALEQLVEPGQARAIGEALASQARAVDGALSVAELLARIEGQLSQQGLESLERRLTGQLSWFRRFELAAVLNRVRSLRVRSEPA